MLEDDLDSGVNLVIIIIRDLTADRFCRGKTLTRHYMSLDYMNYQVLVRLLE